MSGHDNPDEPTVLGGYGPVTKADEEVKAVFDQVKDKFLKQSGVNATKVTVIEYKEQMVHGTNYVMKVQYGDNKYAFVQVHQPLPNANKPPSLESFKLDKTKEDRLEPLK
ncbi:cystatin-A-like [Hyperolius riggenbachi]|uniref:cystatin-A-like n=1 Tax=Hyperolius riggenbachi TaxID=752182 RepID=UPI0035A3C481